MFEKKLYIITIPICFWSVLAFFAYIFLRFKEPTALGTTIYTSYLNFFPILLLCILGCGSSIAIGLVARYEKDQQMRIF
jgi:hypothetical protein